MSKNKVCPFRMIGVGNLDGVREKDVRCVSEDCALFHQEKCGLIK